MWNDRFLSFFFLFDFHFFFTFFISVRFNRLDINWPSLSATKY